MIPEERNFKHSGKLGDVIYALPTIRALGGGVLHLAEIPGLGFGPRQVQALAPLLRAQPYIRGVKIWNGKPAEYDLDEFRTKRVERENLASTYLSLYGLPDAEKDRAWIEAPGVRESPTNTAVLARSSLHPGVPGFWHAVLDRFGSDVAFVGTSEEYGRFAAEFGGVPYRPTSDLLELAALIRSAKVFVGNQSCPYAIAEGLKVPTIQECDIWSPNCVFNRPTAFYVSNERHLRTLVDGRELKPNACEVALAAKPAVGLGPFAGALGPAEKAGASVIILAYNSMKTIKRCALSVVASLCDDDELILIDNHSADGTARFLSYFQGKRNTTVILNGANRGFSAANNQGILASRGRNIVLLNPDTEVQPGWLQAMAGRFENPEVGAVGPVADNGLAAQFVRFHLPEGYSGSAEPANLAEAAARAHPGQSIETKLLIGFCLMIRREALNRSGLLDESMFLGSEDLDISWRLRELGYKLLIARDVFVAHDFGSSFSSLPDGERERLLSESTLALVKKIRGAYAPNMPPTSTEIWGIDIVPDEKMLMDLEVKPMKKKSKKPSNAKPSAPAETVAVGTPKECAEIQPGFHERWCDRDSLIALEALGHKVKDLTGAIIELGSWEGASTCAMANAVNPEPMYAVDTWQGNVDEAENHETVRILKDRDVKAVFETNMKAFTSDNVQAVQQDCHEFLASFEGPVKYCHIDACHDYESVRRAIEAVLPKVVPGGVLCGDDFVSAHANRTDLKGGVQRAVIETLPGFFQRGNFWYWVNPA